MNTLDDSTLLFRVAQYYYINDLSQNQISKLENISRPQISRLLKKAREMGIVKIDVSLPHILDKRELEEKLKTVLNIGNVIISPSVVEEKENEAMLYTMAASYLCQVMGQYKNVGIGWGKSLYHTSLQLAYQEEHKYLTFYPIVGNSGTDVRYLQTNSITDRFAEKFQAKAYYNNALFIAPKNTYTDIACERLEHLRKCWNNLDAIVIGLGGKMFDKKLFIDEMPQTVFRKQLFDQVVGDILGTFFLDDKTILQISDYYQVVSMDWNYFKHMKDIICIAHGTHKIEAILYAAANGYMKTLITDGNTAKEILEHL